MQLKLITPESELLSADTDYVTVPGEVGELGILPHHTFLVSLLVAGEVAYQSAGKTHRYQITGGHVEVANDVIIVMADSATAVSSSDTLH